MIDEVFGVEVVLNNRCWEILNIFLRKTGPLTIDNIADELNVSNKTIRNDLDLIEDYLKSNNLGKLVKKPRIGVWLEATQENSFFIKNMIDKKQMYIHPYSSEDRMFYIIRKLLLSNEPLIMQDIADELYVSKATMIKDLEEAEEWLKKYNLKVMRRQNYGMEIVGSENDWRKAMVELLMILKDDEEIRNLLSLEGEDVNKRISQDYFKYLEKILPDIDLIRIYDILVDTETNMKFVFTDETFLGLFIHIAISVERVKKKKDIKTSYKHLNFHREQKEYEVAEWIAKRIEEEFNIKLPEPEIGYILLHIMGAKIQENFEDSDAEDILANVDEKIVEFAKQMIIMIGNVLSIDFSGDEKLLAGLVLHLRPAVNRLKYGMTLRNPLLDEIKKKYSSIYGAVWTTSVLFEKFFGAKVNEEEIGYIALHIGAALVRLNEKTRAVVVCSSGIGTAQLVAERLKNEIPELEIVSITSVFSLEKIKSTDFDIILSTIPVSIEKFKSKPLINISVFVNEDDVFRIKKYVKNVQNTRKFDKSVLNGVEENLFRKELIFVNQGFKTKETIIKYMCNALLKNGYVKDGFLQSVLEREKIITTSVGKGVAIPHGNTQMINEPVIAVMTLKEPIEWDNDKVSIVFLLAYYFDTGVGYRAFFKKFFRLLNDEKELDRIKKSKDSFEVYNNLLGEE